MAAATISSLPAGLARWTPSLPNSLVHLFNPFGSADADAPHDKLEDALDPPSRHSQSGLKRPILPADQLEGPAPSSPSRSTSTMFAEPETRSNSDGGSREGSVDGRSSRLKRSTRPKTQFSICHPPPESKARQKLHRRPRSLLQLHRLSANTRPRPALEVVPSANFNVRLTRTISSVFKAKHGLCVNDLVVLKAEKYNTLDEDEDREVQDVIGLICKGRIADDKNAGKVRIHFASGREWDAHPAANGGYEFCSTDEHGLGLTVRWVPKKFKDASKGKAKDANRRFNFSTICPNSRRHPVIASLSSTSLDINDSYKIPEATPVTLLNSPKLTAAILEETMAEETGGSDECQTDEQLREIITVTAIFVMFKEGWSPSFKYDDKEKDGTMGATSPTKTGSFSISTPPASPTAVQLDNRSSLKSIGSGIIRRSSILSKSNRSSTASVLEETETEDVPKRSPSIASRTGRSRANSSSTVLVHRAASNRRKNNSQATWRPDLLFAQDALQETSREDLSRDFSTPTKKTPSPLAQGKENGHRDSVAQPLIPDDTGSGAETPPPRSRTPVDTLELPRNHRESTATTDTSSSSSPTKKSKKKDLRGSQKMKKKGSWRRLFCGSSHGD